VTNVQIKPLLGSQSTPTGTAEDCDTGLDAVYIVSKAYPVPKRVGFVAREKNAPIQLCSGLSASELAAVRKAVANRECDKGEVDRQINAPVE